MKMQTNTLLLCCLHYQLRLEASYPFNFIVELLQRHGFARATRLVGQLVEEGLLHGPVHALQLTSPPLVHANPAELQPLAEHLNSVQHPDALAYGFSLFDGPITNLVPFTTINPYRLWRQLTNPPKSRRAKLDAVRDTKYGTKEYKLAKRALPYITPAGIFLKRDAAGLVRASGLGILDYDNFPDVKKIRDALVNDRACHDLLALIFISPSRRGLKVLVRLPDGAADYATGLLAVHECLSGRHPALGSVYDRSGSDISRACFLPEDPTAWLNEDFQPTTR